MLQTWLAIAYKELRQLLRGVTEMRDAMILQAIQIALLGFIDVNARDLPTVIVDQDESSYSRELVQKLQATETLKITHLTTSIEQARTHIRAGRARVGVVIPPDFGRMRSSHAQASVLALVDGSDSVASTQALSAIEGVTARLTHDAQEADPDSGARGGVSAHTMLLFNPEGKTSNFTLPALLAVLLMGEWAGFAGYALAREREEETLERLLMTPLNFWGYVLGKATPYLAGALVNAVVLLLVMTLGFDVPIRGSLPLLVTAMVLYCATVVALGMYFGADSGSGMEVAGRVNDLTFPALFLSGYIFPLSSIPKWLLPVSYLLPATHMVEIMRGITLRGVGIADLWVSFLYISVAPFVLMFLAIRKLRKSINT